MQQPATLLATGSNWHALEVLHQQQLASPVALTKVSQALRKAGYDADVAAALTSQLELRQIAQAKFGEAANHMLFTRPHLEQATRLRVALLHARRFKEAGITTVADLGCGLGAESMALAMLGLKVKAIDKDPEAIACAAVNLRPFENATVLQGDLFDFDAKAAGADALFLDPARRDPTVGGQKGRTLDPEKWSPPWSAVLNLAAGPLPIGVKVAPGIMHQLLPPGFFTQWLSVEGDLVEATTWSPQLAPEGPGVSAALLNEEGLQVLTGKPAVPDVGDLSKYFFEPDSAVIRAGLVGNLAQELRAHLTHPKIAYGTSDSVTASPFATWFEVLDTCPLRTKHIRHKLKALDAGVVEVKKRGADIDPAALQKQLNGTGTASLTVFATRVGEKHRAIIARRVPR